MGKRQFWIAQRIWWTITFFYNFIMLNQFSWGVFKLFGLLFKFVYQNEVSSESAIEWIRIFRLWFKLVLYKNCSISNNINYRTKLSNFSVNLILFLKVMGKMRNDLDKIIPKFTLILPETKNSITSKPSNCWT